MSSQAIFQAQVIQKAWEDPSFMEMLKTDPKAALKDVLGISFPEHVQLKTVEEKSDEFYLVIPPKPSSMMADAKVKLDAGW